MKTYLACTVLKKTTENNAPELTNTEYPTTQPTIRWLLTETNLEDPNATTALITYDQVSTEKTAPDPETNPQFWQNRNMTAAITNPKLYHMFKRFADTTHNRTIAKVIHAPKAIFHCQDRSYNILTPGNSEHSNTKNVQEIITDPGYPTTLEEDGPE